MQDPRLNHLFACSNELRKNFEIELKEDAYSSVLKKLDYKLLHVLEKEDLGKMNTLQQVSSKSTYL